MSGNIRERGGEEPTNHQNEVCLLGCHSARPSNISTVSHGQVEHGLLPGESLVRVELVQDHGQYGDDHGTGGGVADEHGEGGGDQHEGRQQPPAPRARHQQHPQGEAAVDTNILTRGEYI